MIKIMGTWRGRREKLDDTYDPVEADRLRDLYAEAFHADETGWQIELVRTQGQDQLEQIAALRNEGWTHGEIEELTGLRRTQIDSMGARTGRLGMTQPRPAGQAIQPATVKRNERIIELVKAGKRYHEIAEELGMKYLTVRATIYKLRKEGVLDASDRKTVGIHRDRQGPSDGGPQDVERGIDPLPEG